MKAIDDFTWFCCLYYGYADPDCTMVYWIMVNRDKRLHVRAELRLQEQTIENICREIAKRTRHLGITAKPLMWADEDNIGKPDGDGETRADTFASNGVSLQIIKPDGVQGWTRIRELLGLRPDGKPWLTIDPRCEYLIRALTSAIQDKTHPDDILTFPNEQPLKALRVGVMSRPAPKWDAKPELPKNSVGALVEEIRNQAKAS